jgi:BirA family biotin operon repressor/biotin-[acetyl-CoA-carboxylase] ligase
MNKYHEIEWLEEALIRAELDATTLHKLFKLEILNSIDSTNRYLLSQSGWSSGSAVLSEQQTAGRGRRGRPWVSPLGRNIYLSLLWCFPADAVLTGLSLAVGVMLVQALESYGLSGIGLKWPNDIVYSQQKLGGILVETSRDASGTQRAVIGMGLNLQMPKSAEEITQPWVDVYTLSQQKPQRNRLAGLILKSLLAGLPEFQSVGLRAFSQIWEKSDVLCEQLVNVHTAEGILYGVAKGIDELGNLQVEINQQIRTFNSGEVSIRRADIKNTPV